MLRIGYLHARGNQAPYAGALSEAAAALGHNLQIVPPGDLSEDSPLDVVISTTPAVGKTTSHPTFLADHRPRAAYFETGGVFENLASYDGYLCISKPLARFFRSVAASLDKPLVDPGFFHFPPQAAAAPANIGALVAAGRLRLCYVPQGADSLTYRLQRRLSAELQGTPQESERSRTDVYAQSGAGLVFPPQAELLDDVVPEALFQIIGAGASAICPDMAWIREQFGDEVFYYRSRGSLDDIQHDIDQAMQMIRSDPQAAQAKAQAACSRITDRFGAQAMLASLADYHRLWLAADQVRAAQLGDPVIDVVMRVGGRPVEVIARAVASLDRQTVGRYRLILAAYRPLDLAAITGRAYDRIIEIEVVDALGGNRARTLAAGLDRVRSSYFCILDDDDYLLAGHIAGLLQALGRSKDAFRFAYSDVLRLDEAAESASAQESRISLLQCGPAHGDIFSLLARLPSHCFLATSNGLDEGRHRHWTLDTAEDGLLIASLLRRATPVHSPNATAVYCVGRQDASAFLKDHSRGEDELTLVTEVASWRSDIEASFPATVADRGEMIGPFARRVIEDWRERERAGADGPHVSDWLRLAAGDKDTGVQPRWGEDLHGGAFADEPMVFLHVPLDGGRVSGSGCRTVSQAGAAALQIEASQPWEVPVRISIADYAIEGCSTTVLATVDGADSSVLLGLVNPAGDSVAKSRLPADTATFAIMATGPHATPQAAVILQAGRVPPVKPLLLRGLRLGYRLAELRVALAEGHLDRDQLLARLQSRVLNQVLGAPAAPPVEFKPISFRTPACVFRHALRDGPYAQGAPRILASGTAPWDYFAQIHVPAVAGEGQRWLRVSVRDTAESFYAFVVDEAFETRLCPPVAVAAGKAAVDIWLLAPERASGAYIIFQAGDAPADLPMTLARVEAAA